jgi:hypothetical protein
MEVVAAASSVAMLVFQVAMLVELVAHKILVEFLTIRCIPSSGHNCTEDPGMYHYCIYDLYVFSTIASADMLSIY